MATAGYKVLGQLAPTSTAEASFSAVGTGKAWVISSFTISNLTATNAYATLSICVGGTTTSNANTLIKDVLIPANSMQAFTIGIALAATDVIRVTSGTANALSFQIFGTEITL
jgi:hypothetical protein